MARHRIKYGLLLGGIKRFRGPIERNSLVREADRRRHTNILVRPVRVSPPCSKHDVKDMLAGNGFLLSDAGDSAENCWT